jgi:eukaryotic-like serine/threonine-protein kinase
MNRKSGIFAAGTILNQLFEVEGLLERGTNTLSYAAREIESDRTFILKVLKLEAAESSTRLLSCHENEARCLSRLRHRNIARLFNFLIAESGEPYMVMEYFQGKKLSKLIAENRGIAYERAAGIFAQICNALESAHKSGVVLRELRPERVLVSSSESASDFVKLFDFSPAVCLPESGSCPPLPDCGQSASPCYLSPELLRNNKADARSDVFSMGCLAYETLLGVPPFTVAAVESAARKHGLLSAPRFRDLRPDLKHGDEIEKVVRQALEKDPRDRFAGMECLKDAFAFAASKQSLADLDLLSRSLKNLLEKKNPDSK